MEKKIGIVCGITFGLLIITFFANVFNTYNDMNKKIVSFSEAQYIKIYLNESNSIIEKKIIEKGIQGLETQINNLNVVELEPKEAEREITQKGWIVHISIFDDNNNQILSIMIRNLYLIVDDQVYIISPEELKSLKNYLTNL